MSETRSPGATRVSAAGPTGMITLRADLSAPKVAQALTSVLKMDVPQARRIVASDLLAVGWMSPDEVLIVCPHADADGHVAALSKALDGEHHLAVNVSDARAVFDIAGPRAREVLAKLCPVDLHPDSFAAGELRRTRAAQVPAAFWMTGDEGIRLVCFRSVAGYVEAILQAAASPGSEVGVF